MRDYLIFAIVFGLLPFIFKRPVIGVLAFTWLSLMNPHRLTYGAAFDFPFAALVAGVTLIGLAFSKEPKRFPVTNVTVLFIIFTAWITFTTFFALEPKLAWIEWERVMKAFFMVALAMAVLNTEKDIKAFAWVVGLSVAFYGLKGGVFTILSGGVNRVHGPLNSYIADNNDMALALVISVPIIWYLFLNAEKKWLRISLAGVAFFTVVAAVGTYSRGALLAGIAMFVFLWLKGQHKLRTGLALLVILPLILTMMPEQWFDRMQSIGEYKEDASALGRFNAWLFAINVAKNHILGGGFNVFTPGMFFVYAPDPLDPHAAHSIYFRVLGEHGVLGLGIFILFMFFAWRTGTRVQKFCRRKSELKWASDLAGMSQVSLIGFAVGGAFLSLAYFDLYYNIVAILVLMEKLLINKIPQTLQSAAFPSSTSLQDSSGRRSGV